MEDPAIHVAEKAGEDKPRNSRRKGKALDRAGGPRQCPNLSRASDCPGFLAPQTVLSSQETGVEFLISRIMSLFCQ